MTDELNQPENRIITEAGIDAQVAALIEPTLMSMGYQLVRVRVTGQNGQTLQIMCERFDGTMGVDECTEVSRAISPIMDVEDPLSGNYHLEISSPGIDRPMVRRQDFKNWAQHTVKCETSMKIDGRRRFRGVILQANDDSFILKREKATDGDVPDVEIAYDLLVDARLILTDELIEAAFKAEKKAKAARPTKRVSANENNDTTNPQDEGNNTPSDETIDPASKGE